MKPFSLLQTLIESLLTLNKCSKVSVESPVQRYLERCKRERSSKRKVALKEIEYAECKEEEEEEGKVGCEGSDPRAVPVSRSLFTSVSISFAVRRTPRHLQHTELQVL